VRKLTTPAEKVVVLTPVYNTFYNSILNNGRQVSECPMLYREGGYQVDYEDLEKKLADPQASLMILCNPHNPIGKIWSLEELKKIGELCKKHSVVVVSDEIHCDLVDPQKEYVPFVLAGEDCRQNAIVCMAPTKTFNLAGIQTAAAAVPNPTLRHKVWRALNTDEVAEPNSFAITAAIAAFEEGEPWLLALQDYLYANKQLVASYLKENCPDLQLLPSEATYLLWLRVADLPGDKTNLAPFIRKETGLYLTAGYHYRGDGKDFMRMNIACPRSTLTDALSRLKKGVELWKEKQIKG
jgi:cystathionine beta-lyase